MTCRAAPLLPLLAVLAAFPAAAQKPAPAPGPAVPVPIPVAPVPVAPTAPPAAPELPPGLVACTRLEGVTADPNAREADRTRAVLRDGRLATVVLDLPGGRTTRTDLSPGRRDGTSVRLLAFPQPSAPGAPPSGAWNTVFNLATVAPDGTILVETWLSYTDRPAAPPVHNWYRLRCETAPATPAPGAPRPAAPRPGPIPGGSVPGGPIPGTKG